MIESLPLPPIVRDVPDAIDAEEAVKRSVSQALNIGPRILDDEHPCSFTIKTSRHTVLVGFNIDGPDEDDPLDVSNLPEFLDEVLALGAPNEPVQTISLVIPMAAGAIIHGWDAMGRTAYTSIWPGPFPNSLMVDHLHCHMPPVNPDLPDEDNVLVKIIQGSGKHLWGPLWALLPQVEGTC